LVVLASGHLFSITQRQPVRRACYFEKIA
jgi:hypothetical protein